MSGDKPLPSVRRRDYALARGQTEFISEARAAAMLDANPWAGATLLILLAIVVTGYLWASTAILDEVTVGQGRVVPSSREQLVQSLEGGILSEMLVREGDKVEKDQVLLRIDDTRFGAPLRETRSRQHALRAATARLLAEAEGVSPRFPADIGRELVRIETNLYTSRKQQLEESLAALKRSFQLAEEELNKTAPLAKQGVVSEVEVLRLQRQVNDLRANLQERLNRFRADARAELAKNEAELAALAEVSTARADQVRRTVVRSPMRGTVKNVRVSTVGGVIQPGVDIMEIVPLEDQLLIEARIRPSDVAFLRPGLAAMVKISAYDYSIYGGLEGTLEQISADTIRDDRKQDESYYRVLVRTKYSALRNKDVDLPIIPGMTATVEILTGQKTVLDYLLKPLLKARDGALRER
jgi:adhesin transport system membrane fusion protein